MPSLSLVPGPSQPSLPHRSAAPYQKLRRNQAIKEGKVLRKVYVEKSDMRAKKMARKVSPTTLVALDPRLTLIISRLEPW